MDAKEEFIASIYPAAKKISQETGMSWELILAQAAHETGWGQKVLPGTNNIFNIKADRSWKGESKTFNVWERDSNGKVVWLDQPFRVYGSLDDALLDRVQFLRENPRYNKAGLFDKGTLGNLQKEADALQKAGYATDEDYAQKLAGIFNGPTMRRSIALATAKETEMAPKLASALHQGEHGPAVKELQRQLHGLGYTDVYGRLLEVDGLYGPSTKHVIETFQRDKNLHVDGVAGPNTLAALREATQAASLTVAMTPLAHDTSVSPRPSEAVTVPAISHADAATQDAFSAIQAQLRELQRQLDAMNHLREQVPAKEREQDNERDVPHERAPQAVHSSNAAPGADGVIHHNAACMTQTGSGLSGFDPVDPRHERHPLNGLYNELKTRIPDASERRLLQFAAACHSHHITAENLGRIDFNQQDGIITFCPSWPPGPVATIDLKTPSPEPQQSIADIQQYDRQHAQMMAQIQAQVALTNAHGLQGPVLGGPSR